MGFLSKIDLLGDAQNKVEKSSGALVDNLHQLYDVIEGAAQVPVPSATLVAWCEEEFRRLNSLRADEQRRLDRSRANGRASMAMGIACVALALVVTSLGTWLGAILLVPALLSLYILRYDEQVIKSASVFLEEMDKAEQRLNSICAKIPEQGAN